MKLVIITGPHAVGKMTVGQALAAQTGLKLFHNHMSIEGICDIFERMPQQRWYLTNLIRDEVFKAFAPSDEYGMIFTFMWAYDFQDDWDYLAHVEEIFAPYHTQVYYVELEADHDVRIERNKTENRLLNKPSKRNIARSEALFLSLESKYRLNSRPGEVQKTNYLRINNTNLSPDEAAGIIKAHFAL